MPTAQLVFRAARLISAGYVLRRGVFEKNRGAEVNRTVAPYNQMKCRDQHGRELETYDIEWKGREA